MVLIIRTSFSLGLHSFFLRQDLCITTHYGIGSFYHLLLFHATLINQNDANNLFFLELSSYGDFEINSWNMQRNGIFFISGDVHFGEITRYDCGCQYPLYDITSSGLTQAVEKAVPSSLAFFLRVIAWLVPSTMRVFGPYCRYRSCTYGRLFFYTVIFMTLLVHILS